MITTKIPYKVLWVDDNLTIVDGMIAAADEFTLELQHFSNWNDAKRGLLDNYAEYTAIILDAFCKISADSTEQESFITSILPELMKIMAEHNRDIPWYILSAGTMSNFNFVVESAEFTRQDYTEYWGPMLYLKDKPDKDEQSPRALFERIQSNAPNYHDNIILRFHHDVFKHFGDRKFINSRAREIVMKSFRAMYFPEESKEFAFDGNALRKVIEYIFRGIYSFGLLPAECFDGNEVKIKLCSLYLAGGNVSYDRSDKRKQIRWGEQSPERHGKGGDAIFTKEIADALKYILDDFVQPDSHTTADEPFLFGKGNKELYFACLLHICHIIKWLGKYIDEHPDVEKNRAMERRFTNESIDQQVKASEKAKTAAVVGPPVPAQELKGYEGIVLSGKTCLYMLVNGFKCKLIKKIANSVQVGSKQTVNCVSVNDKADAYEYPFIITDLVRKPCGEDKTIEST